MENSIDVGQLLENVRKLPPEQRVAVLWDIISMYKDEPELALDDLLFFRKVALRFNLDKSLIDLMLH